MGIRVNNQEVLRGITADRRRDATLKRQLGQVGHSDLSDLIECKERFRVRVPASRGLNQILIGVATQHEESSLGEQLQYFCRGWTHLAKIASNDDLVEWFS